MLLRAACGLWLVGAALGAGFMARSPWSILLLGAAFSVLFVLGKWDAWKHAWRTSGATSVALGAASVLPVQCGMVALFYGAALMAAKLGSADAHLRPVDGFDVRYATVVLGVGVALALAANLLEARASSDDHVLRQLLEEDEQLPPELKAQIVGANRDAERA